MQLKDITCDFKYAKKLKNLGVDQASSFSVFYGNEVALPIPFNDVCFKTFDPTILNRDEGSRSFFTSTFTTEEFLDILPKDVKHKKYSYYLCMGYDGEHGLPMAWYEDNNAFGTDEILISYADNKLSNALARILIWLLKNRKIKPYIKKTAKENKKQVMEVPTERTIYKRLIRKMYSFKYGCWVIKTKVALDKEWYSCKLIREDTGEVIEEIGMPTESHLRERVLSYVNNPKLF